MLEAGIRDTLNLAIHLQPGYRLASKADARAMAELINIAGEGMPLYLWTKMAAGSKLGAWEIGRKRALRESGGFSYRNAVVREVDGAVVALLIGYPIADELKAANYDELPAMFVPLQQLEDLAAGTWYVNALGTYPEHRGMGYGTDLLSIAEEIGLDLGKRGMSLIVSDANIGARRLYKRAGFEEIAIRPMVKNGWQNPGREWVLMIKGFG